MSWHSLAALCLSEHIDSSFPETLQVDPLPARLALRSALRANVVTTPLVRFRLDFGTRCRVGPGKIALLEAIHRTGSLSQAARDLDMSYRRAWQLVSSLNASFCETIVSMNRGGHGGGGAQVTSVGRDLIRHYRTFERHIQARAERAFRTLSGKARTRSQRTGAAPVIRLSSR